MNVAGWPGSATRFLALRLSPGDDLRGSLEAAFTTSGARAGFVVSCIGSLSRATLRHAGRDEETATDGTFELVSLSGTLSRDGVHLHASLSDGDGKMFGGHVLAGCVVRTTAEVLLGLTDAVAFGRAHDPETGYAELSLTD